MSTTTTSTFSHPFTKASADVVLRTPDGVEFRVHRVILSEASPVFENMFKLPQPKPQPADASSASPTTDVPELLVIDVTETGHTLDHHLRFCYPMDDPVLELGDIAPIIGAARKYDMHWAIDLARRYFPLFREAQGGAARMEIYLALSH
ncbi:hypothetical protein BV20DRAFT_939207 [Pilatotrama ljubarskyi]|nr:hypothetical protein BV20DRAFT_939207 [Pilatotrama ljubarskyi]